MFSISSEKGLKSSKMMHQQFRIWWPFLWFPLILSQFQPDKICFKNVDYYECLNLNISEVGREFKQFNEVMTKFVF